MQRRRSTGAVALETWDTWARTPEALSTFRDMHVRRAAARIDARIEALARERTALEQMSPKAARRHALGAKPSVRKLQDELAHWSEEEIDELQGGGRRVTPPSARHTARGIRAG